MDFDLAHVIDKSLSATPGADWLFERFPYIGFALIEEQSRMNTQSAFVKKRVCTPVT